MDHFRVKIYARPDSTPDLAEAIPVFHRWIQQRTFHELLIDVADYRHVPQGPGVLLVGYDAFRSLDSGGHGLGLLYTRRTTMEGTVEQKLRAALEAGLETCAKLEAEPEFAGRLRFDRGDLEVSVNDRVLAPNDEDTWRALQPVLRAVFPDADLQHTGDSRDLFTVAVKPTVAA
jgi:hypothetical protein